jgi:activator of Hsp90 ATPase-like protein
MKDKSYTVSIEVAATQQHVFDCLTDVSKWWAGGDLKGNSTKPGDEFTVIHGTVHYSKQKLTEVIPGRKMVWMVTESKLDWLKNRDEWTNTKMIFEIIPKGDMTELRFTNEGLVPEKECYARCTEGWDMVIRENLYNFITKGTKSF